MAATVRTSARLPQGTHGAAPVPLLPLVLVAMLYILAINLTAPAADGIARALALSPAAIARDFTAFMLAGAGSMLVSGPLSDLFGRRRVLDASLVAFVAGSILCAASHAADVFAAGRILQAAGAAGIVIARAVVRDTSDGPAVARRLGALAAGTALAPLAAPLIGGLAAEYGGWRAVFVLLAAAGILALALVNALPGLGGRSAPGAGRYRWEAMELAGLARFWLSAGMLASLGIPFFAFAAGTATVAEALALTPTETGLGMMAMTAGYAAGTLIGRDTRAWPVDAVVAGNALALAAVVALCSLLLAAAPAVAAIPLLLMLGLGNGIALPGAVAAAIGLRPRLAGTASGIISAAQVAGGALAGSAVALLDGGAWGGSVWTVLVPMLAGGAAALLFCLALRPAAATLPQAA